MNKKKVDSILKGITAAGIAMGGVSSIQGADMVMAAINESAADSNSLVDAGSLSESERTEYSESTTQSMSESASESTSESVSVSESSSASESAKQSDAEQQSGDNVVAAAYTDDAEQDMAVLRLLLAVLHTIFSKMDEDGQDNVIDTPTKARKRWRALWEKGYFKDEGLDLMLITGFGADKTMTAVISGEADIGFMGAEASIYAYQEGATDPVVNFAQLTQRAGNFLVAREEMPDFKWEDLKGRKVLGGRKGGMPEMVFEYILKQNGLDPQKDLSIDQSIDFGATAAAFTGDDSADFTVEFEPSATALEKQGTGYVVASLGVDSGYVPYTSYSAKTSYMKKNPDIMQKFTNALQKGMDYVQSHTPEEIAEVIEPQFPETDLDTVTTIVKRYYDQDTWKENLVFGQDGFELLQDILEDAGELKERTPYAELVNTEFAKNAS